jgi:ABC-type uncharacterized transport system permease subunit
MKELPKRIKSSYSWQRFPKFSLGFVPALISIELAFSLFIGYFIAVFFAGSRTKAKNRSKVPSLVFQFRQYRIHLHHWLLFLHVMVFAMVAQFFLITPLLFYGFLGGIVAQGVFHYEDWHTVIEKVS